MSARIAAVHGGRLLKLARDVIGHRLGIVASVDGSDLDNAELQQLLASFVTLKIGESLRGCIGNLQPVGPLVQSVRDNAVSAAFCDHRFSPLTSEEFGQIGISISVLSQPQRLEYGDASHLLALLRPGIDGVILTAGRARATFLPQVWEQLPGPEQFLEHLCQKAGLSRSAWREIHPEVEVYQVQQFEEQARQSGEGLVVPAPISESLARLYDDMAAAYDQSAGKLRLICSDCPDNCCDSYFLHHTYIEWSYLWQGMQQLPAEKQQEILARAEAYERGSEAALKAGVQPQIMCPLNEAGRCILYPYRLMVCRTHGVPAAMTRPDGRRLSFPGCFRCQEKVSAYQGLVPVMERTVLLQRLVALEQELLAGKRQQLPRVRMTIARMLLDGPPPLPGSADRQGR